MTRVKVMETLSPKKEDVLIVLARNGKSGMHNQHVLEEIREADQGFGRRPTSLGTFYSTVKRLEDEGFIKGFWGERTTDSGARRRFLKITAKGKKVLHNTTMRRIALEGSNGIAANDAIPP